MPTVAIMGNGPIDRIPKLSFYKDEIDVWIGADRGALTLVENGITVNYSLGDFDSVDAKQREMIINHTIHFDASPVEKDKTDLEIALDRAFEIKPEKLYLFGITGGRLDHELINIQLLHTIIEKGIRGIMIDQWNQLELTKPGTYTIHNSEKFPYISFIPFTKHVKNLSLTGFYYPLTNYDISWGSTRCISNKLVSENGMFTYEEGMLLFVKSRDAFSTGGLRKSF